MAIESTEKPQATDATPDTTPPASEIRDDSPTETTPAVVQAAVSVEDEPTGESAEIIAEGTDEETEIVPAKPVLFEDWNLSPELTKALDGMGYDIPMPVQVAVYKSLTAGRDLMVQSKTGSGKTAAFGIPIAQMLSDAKKGVQALILAPTRELALQVAKEIEKLTEHMDVSVMSIYGGAPIGPQIAKLEEGTQIVAGTPGRILDHIRRKTLDTSGIRMLTLDECDEMLSMGFQEEIENIIKTLPDKEHRQTLLFSATIPKEIERIGRRYLRDPEMVTLSSDSVGAELIDHYYYVVSGMARTRDLIKLMKAERPESAIIFCNTREETNTVARSLCKAGYDAEALSSDLSQKDRERVMGRMRDKNLHFLVATDIAARGIDISELSHVINYTFPPSPEVYVHRSGRTGRAGKEGTALSLVGPREIGSFYNLKLIYKIKPTERELPTNDEMKTIKEGEQYEGIIAQLDGTPGKGYEKLARRLWQSSQGQRVVGILLENLLTKKAAKPAAATPVSALATIPAATPAPESEAPATVSVTPSASQDDQRNDGTDRKRRRRRRGRDVSETRNSSTEMTSTEGAPVPVESDFAEGQGDRVRRKRRRREHSEDTVESSETAEAEILRTASETSPLEQSDGANTEDSANQPTAEANTAAEEVSEETSQRRKKRRGRGASSESSRSPRSTHSEAPTKTTTRLTRKPRIDPGPHAEFWEAWASQKVQTPAPTDSPEAPQPGDATTSESTEAKATDTGSADAKAADEPEKKKRRRRRGPKSEETVDESTAQEVIPAEPAAVVEQHEETKGAETTTPTVRLFVNIGKREDTDVDGIRGFLSDALGDIAEGLGRITLRNNHCYVRVNEDIADQVIETCSGLMFQEREMLVERARR